MDTNRLIDITHRKINRASRLRGGIKPHKKLLLTRLLRKLEQSKVNTMVCLPQSMIKSQPHTMKMEEMPMLSHALIPAEDKNLHMCMVTLGDLPTMRHEEQQCLCQSSNMWIPNRNYYTLQGGCTFVSISGNAYFYQDYLASSEYICQQAPYKEPFTVESLALPLTSCVAPDEVLEQELVPCKRARYEDCYCYVTSPSSERVYLCL